MLLDRDNRTRAVRIGLVIALLSAFAPPGMAQHAEQDLPQADSTQEQSHLYEIMKKGELDGRFRQYNMATVNDGAPSDFYAIAFGGTLGFTSQRWHGVQFKLSGGYTFQLAGSDLTVPDAVAGLYNRYEIGLYDVTDPRRTNDLAYLHEFQLNYASQSARTNAVFGKQELNTPFLNLQDGRMHPTLFEGAWVKHRTSIGTSFEGGWLYRVAPRGTSNWYLIDESTQIYSAGRNILGQPTAHGEYQRSAGIFAASVKQPVTKRVSITVWDVLVENMFNTALLQLDAGHRDQGVSISAQAVQQTPLASHHTNDPEQAYMPTGEDATAFSARLRHVPGKFRWQLNYTRITAHGRYLMPREWGRDPFFTFLPRERNEGLGDVHAGTLNLILKDAVKGLRVEADAGAYWLPAISDARLNKYAMPSYAQFAVNTQYQFTGGWKGLAVQLLYLVKLPLYDQDLTAKQAFNKVDMHHADLVINYSF